MGGSARAPVALVVASRGDVRARVMLVLGRSGVRAYAVAEQRDALSLLGCVVFDLVLTEHASSCIDARELIASLADEERGASVRWLVLTEESPSSCFIAKERVDVVLRPLDVGLALDVALERDIERLVARVREA